jgi:hypothetical protein
MFRFVCNGWQNRAMCLHQVCVKLGKSTTKILEMLRETFGKYSLSRTAVFEWHSCFKVGQVSIEDDERSGRPSTSKMKENIRTHQRRSLLNNPWARRHCWDQLWSLPGDLNGEFEHALHCSFITTMHLPTLPWKPWSLWLITTWLLFPILPTCQT